MNEFNIIQYKPSVGDNMLPNTGLKTISDLFEAVPLGSRGQSDKKKKGKNLEGFVRLYFLFLLLV